MGRAIRRSWLKASMGGLLLAGLALLLAWIDPFGLESDSEKFSADLAQYVASPFYGRGLGGDLPVGQRRITVVYLDEDSLEQLYPLWKGFPPSYLNQQELLATVLEGGQAGRPRAVFIDFAFLAKGRYPEEFQSFADSIGAATRADKWQGRSACRNDEVAKLACILAAGGVPVILGGDKRARDKPAEDARGPLLAVAAVASLMVDQRAYPLLADRDTGDSPAAMMYLADRLAVVDCTRPDPADEPVWRLRCAADTLINGPAANPEAATQGVLDAAQAIRDRLGGRFAVRWSSRPDTAKPGVNQLSTALTGLPSDCDGANRGDPLYAWTNAAGRLAGRLTGLRLGRTDGPASDPRPACPYALSVSYGALATGPALPMSLRERLFRNRLVLIGGQFNNSSDWIPTPVHGQLPGVQYHAMALDNLLEADRDEGAFAMPRLDRWTSTASRLLSALLLFLLVTLGGIHLIERNDLRRALDEAPGEPDPRRDAWRMLRLYLRFLAVDLAIILLCAVLATLWRMPINWVAVATIALGHGLWSVREVIGEDLAPLYRGWALSHGLRVAAARLSLNHETLRPPPPPPPEPVHPEPVP